MRQFPSESAPNLTEFGFYLIKNAFLLHPKNELRLVVLLGQALGLEHDTQQRQSHFVARTSAQLACGGMQSTVAPALRAELFEVLEHAGGQLGQTACGGAVGKLVIGPQRAQHLGQVRFTTTVKAGNPHARLLGACIQIDQELVEDGLQPFFVLAIADKGLQLVAQDGLSGFGMVFRHFRHAVVDEAVLLWRFVVDVAVQHGGPSQ